MIDSEMQAKNPVAYALRKAGYIPLPRLWIRRDEIGLIHDIAEKSRVEVNNIRGAASRSHIENQKVTPENNRDAAWAAHEKAQARS